MGVAMLGDSFAYGQGVLGADRRFSNLMEGKIAELGSNVGHDERPESVPLRLG